jgi:hypothetical protein
MVIILLASCGKATKLGLSHTAVYVYSNDTISNALTDTGTNTVSETNGTLRVDIAANVSEVEFDLSPFLNANQGYKGKKFYFTRSDAKKGDGTLKRGSAWYQVGGEPSSRLYKKLGYENDETVTAMTKQEIAALPNSEGELRMYFITSGTQAGKCVVYLDPTTGSAIEAGETRVTYKFHGHNGKKAELKVLVVKNAE